MGPATEAAGCETMSGMKTTLLLATLTGLFLVVGQALGGRSGMTIALVLAAVMNFVSFFSSDKIVLAMYGAKPVGPEEAPELHAMRAADPATAHLFIVNPLSGRSLAGLFSTHPPVEQRIERLMALNR
jgi:Zn-dependent protease with chaperone function